MKQNFKNILSSIGGSYSQVFFSNNPWLALFLIAASFINPGVGLGGLLAVIVAVTCAKYLGLNPAFIHNGWYTYNVLLTGMAIGANFYFNTACLIILFFASLLSLFMSVWIASFTARYRLPFLSLPFVLSVWIIFLNARVFQTNLLIEKNSYPVPSLFTGYINLFSLHIETMGLHKIIIMYFKSMSAIFFQYNAFTGILIALGLLISSRISFFLSWLGFITGYLFYKFSFGANAANEYFYTGFNYIFAGIALAGFYLVPSARSYLLVIISVPVISLISTAMFKLIGPYYLPLFSLPFSVVIIILMAVLNNRYIFKSADIVQYQLYSPEKNLYAFKTYFERFKKETLIHMHLPFYGEWYVSQGNSGNHTHKEDWRFALDFVVTDEHKQTFKLPGKSLTDFYCYNLPVLAPADGEITTVEDGVEDNTIGDVNLNQNWGNTLVIKHGEFLYSKISHLKNGSIKVKTGDKVKRGELLAHCGSSGRSPEPHIHFQLQNTPYIAAPTIDYPLAYYITNTKNNYQLHAFETPKEGETILKPSTTPLLKKAFHFIPGMKLNFEVEEDGKKELVNWEVFTDAYNNSYIYCLKTKSSAHFKTDETLFYFTGFSGNINSLLYHFYLGAYKTMLCYYPGIKTEDYLPVEVSTQKLLKPLQDFIAPFYIFMNPVYRFGFKDSDTQDSNHQLTIQSAFYENKNQSKSVSEFEIEVADNRINKITISKKNKCIVAKNIA